MTAGTLPAMTGPALRLTCAEGSDALYMTLREGDVAETVEVEESVYVDLDDEGRPLGVEFVSAAVLLPFLQRRGGEFVVPARVDDPDTFRFGAAP